jgi:hypothetical protein
MGLADMFNLGGKDVAAFLVAILLGLLCACLVPAGTWAVLTSILVSYHLFLAWLVITAKKKPRVKLPVVSTIATHLACLILIVPLGRVYRFIPFLGIVGLAIFERGWLFTEDKIQLKSEEPPATPAVPDTAEDYKEWINYLAKRSPASRKPGSDLKEEYRSWLLARTQNRLAVLSNDSHPLTNPEKVYKSRSDQIPRRAHFRQDTAASSSMTTGDPGTPLHPHPRDTVPRRAHFRQDTAASSSMTTGDPSTPLHPHPLSLVYRTSVDMEGSHLDHRP